MANNTNKARSPTSSPLVHTGIPLVAVALLGLLAAGAYDALHLQLKRSNVRGHLAVLLNPANPVVRSEYTGFAPVDRLLSILVCFFLPIADALESKPELPVFVLQFGGQVVTPVVLQLVEATRAGNKWNPAGL